MIVHVSHSVMIVSLMPEVTWSTGPDHDSFNARYNRNGSMLDLRKSHARQQFVSANPVIIRVVSGSPFDSRHLCDSHVRYDLSHSTSPP